MCFIRHINRFVLFSLLFSSLFACLASTGTDTCTKDGLHERLMLLAWTRTITFFLLYWHTNSKIILCASYFVVFNFLCFYFIVFFRSFTTIRVGREHVIRLWMGNDFVSSKEISGRIFNDLRWRLLFKDYKKDYLGDWLRGSQFSPRSHSLCDERRISSYEIHRRIYVDESLLSIEWVSLSPDL